VLLAEAQWTGMYQRIAVEGNLAARLGVLRVTPRLRLGWATDYHFSSDSPSAGTTAFRDTIWESVAAIARP